MTFLQALISGIVQGLTEFLPVSSSGHLVIMHKLMGMEGPQLSFDIFLHVGTLAAIFIVFWKDIIEAVTVKRKIGFFILMATAVTVLCVLFFGKGIEAAFGNVKMVGAMLVVTGIWLILGSFLRFGSGGISGLKAILIGLAQAIAVMPGISRSGVTISTGLFLGLDGQAAARFSFLLAIPAIIGAALFKIKDPALTGFSPIYLIGFITSCIIGVLSLKLLLRVLYKNKFHLFGIYCIILGLVALLFL
ncbi:MAG: undecaprenyl-diphosphate phosphatase [Candidatus Gorgyraea atricola]|nr:undecaprenyl-diphosphate phosphatase [Candidatus Gorgyraea atricola]